MNNMATNMNP